ncbi:SAM-dependent methyltransferase, partial [Kitasatospora sp. NPDC004669]|uniref:SAM-dependent methyltransferase n=1 Tax=Kitasatospora sp. NPDC004669 TaxID=3154555 RepID=UPI0033BAF767
MDCRHGADARFVAQPGLPDRRVRRPGARVREQPPRPAPLFVDPYAAEFVTAAGLPTGAPARISALGRALYAHSVLRTRFYDDRLLAARASQVVLPAAGLDARAHRLDWPPGTRLWERDLAPVLAFKELELGPAGATVRCERTVLPGDVLHPEWPGRLVAAGFDRRLPTAWLTEGLLVHLTAEEASGLLTAVGTLSAPGSRLLTERGRDVSKTPRDPALAHVTDLWRGGPGPVPTRGCRPTAGRPARPPSRRWGRPTAARCRPGSVGWSGSRCRRPVGVCGSSGWMCLRVRCWGCCVAVFEGCVFAVWPVGCSRSGVGSGRSGSVPCAVVRV